MSLFYCVPASILRDCFMAALLKAFLLVCAAAGLGDGPARGHQGAAAVHAGGQGPAAEQPVADAGKQGQHHAGAGQAHSGVDAGVYK